MKNAFECAPFSQDHGLSKDEEVSINDSLARLGVRLTPYPFASTFAIVSDVDDSERAFYDAYIGELVDHLGLDFGDSTWLQWQQGYAISGVGLGLFSRHMNRGDGRSPAIFARTRTFLESVAEYTRATSTIFTPFFGNGPRVALLKPCEGSDDRRMAINPGPVQKSGPWSCAHVFVAGVCVVGKAGREIAVRGVSVEDADGGVTDDYQLTPFDAPPERRHRLFVVNRSAADRRSLPKLDTVKAVIVDLEPPSESADIERVLLTSTFGEMVIDRLAYLNARFGIELSLVTEHSAYHFRNPPRTGDDDRRLAEHVQGSNGALETYFGTLADATGELVFSTDADHPHSLCRVFPDLSAVMETRIYSPPGCIGSCRVQLLEARHTLVHPGGRRRLLG